MSEETPKAAEEAVPKKPKAVIALLVLNLGAAGFTTFKVATTEPVAAEPHDSHPAPITNEVVGPVVPILPFIVNLDEPGPSRYIKMTLQFELINHEAEEPFKKSEQLVRDMILSHLSGLKLKDTLGTTAKDKMRSDIMKKIEGIVGPNKVRRMFFQEFMVQ